MSHLFLIEFLLIAGVLLLWIAYEYISVKKLSKQRELEEQQRKASGDNGAADG